MKKVEDKLKAVRGVLCSIEKQFGKGMIMALGERKVDKVATISTGSLSVDAALGVGGLPRGRLVEIFGPESSGKTTLALQAIAQAQRANCICAFIDAEHALDVGYARDLGVDIANLLLSQPDHGEQALEIVDQLVRSGALGLIVVDSVAALVPRAEIEGEMGDRHVGLQARMMSQAMRKVTGAVHRHGTLVVFINQTREKIGVSYGSNITTTGGNALKFYASVRLDIRRIGAIKEGEQHVGNRTRVKVVKNKLAPPFVEAEFEILYGRGVHREAELLDLAMQRNVIVRAGSWFSFSDQQLGQGRGAVCRRLADDRGLREAIERRLAEEAAAKAA